MLRLPRLRQGFGERSPLMLSVGARTKPAYARHWCTAKARLRLLGFTDFYSTYAKAPVDAAKA